MMLRLVSWLFLPPCDRLIEIKSWRPSWGRYGLEWPTMLIDGNGWRRCTSTPVWNWPFVRGIFCGHGIEAVEVKACAHGFRNRDVCPTCRYFAKVREIESAQVSPSTTATTSGSE